MLRLLLEAQTVQKRRLKSDSRGVGWPGAEEAEWSSIDWVPLGGGGEVERGMEVLSGVAEGGVVGEGVAGAEGKGRRRGSVDMVRLCVLLLSGGVVRR